MRFLIPAAINKRKTVLDQNDRINWMQMIVRAYEALCAACENPARRGRVSKGNLPGLPTLDIFAGEVVVHCLGRRLRQHEVSSDLTQKQKAHEDLTPNHSTFLFGAYFPFR